MKDDQHWEHLLSISRDLTLEYPDAIFIGGIAVFQHAVRVNALLAESSHDADLYLSLVGKSTMRDQYEVSRNDRLGKDSVLIEGEDIDLYVERQHRLAVSYDEVSAHATELDGIRVAALEHLLVLKVDAAISRGRSVKGEKDLRDLSRVLVLLEAPRVELLTRHMSDDRLQLIQDVSRRRDLFAQMGINTHEASRLNRSLDANTKRLLKELGRRKRLSHEHDL